MERCELELQSQSNGHFASVDDRITTDDQLQSLPITGKVEHCRSSKRIGRPYYCSRGYNNSNNNSDNESEGNRGNDFCGTLPATISVVDNGNGIARSQSQQRSMENVERCGLDRQLERISSNVDGAISKGDKSHCSSRR